MKSQPCSSEQVVGDNHQFLLTVAKIKHPGAKNQPSIVSRLLPKHFSAIAIFLFVYLVPIFKVQRMLMVDALLTLATWLPYTLYALIVAHIDGFYDNYSPKTVVSLEQSLFLLMMTNMFSTPVVYFVFNRNFRVTLLLVLV